MDSDSHASAAVRTRAVNGEFATTLWSEVVAAGQTTSPGSRAALERLCGNYWYPLYAYVRRQGHGPEDAQDLTQEFFARLLGHKYLRLADRSRGRFRTFLLTSLKHFLINEWTKANRQRRGGGLKVLSLDAQQTESRFLAEPADGRSPDRMFDRQWATVLLDRVLSLLEGELVAAGRGEVFGELKSSLTGEENHSSYAEIGQRLGMTEANLKVTVHRLRKRYREILREEIASTLDEDQSIDAEIRELFTALS